MKSKTTTFLKFLEDYGIEIPIIQRDYAQGRSGKEELRKSFLRDIKSALKSNELMKLDFVYGTIQNGKLIPLDGQQRLTTLWLLHWYIAYRAQKLDNSIINILKKFTYETRISSRHFCEKLVEFTSLPPENTSLIDHIRNQTWFRRSWRNDPTVQSMLRMLEGTTKDKLDGIKGVFSDSFEIYWDRLSSIKCPIVFYHLNLSNITHSDDFYIKMNARGKPLTSFENFKADLAGHIAKKAKTDKSASETWNMLTDPSNGFSISMDTTWMNIFWRNRSKSNSIDEIYFAFLNRFFFNAYVLQLKAAETLGDPIFDHLYGQKNKTSDDSKIAYFGFDDVYKQVLINDETLLIRFKKTLDHFCSFVEQRKTEQEKTRINQAFQAPWEDKSFNFIPCYDESELIEDYAGKRICSVMKITQPQRVVFHAICKFFEQGWDETENQSLDEWLRVVWNIVENANIETISAMSGCLRLVDELAEYSHDILNAIGRKAVSIKSIFAKEQVDEECLKARLIRACPKWEEDIKKAEKHPLLKGHISFLLDPVGEETSHSNFTTRYQKISTSLKVPLDDHALDLMRQIIKKSTIDFLAGVDFSLNNTEANWKLILHKKELADTLRGVLLKEDTQGCNMTPESPEIAMLLANLKIFSSWGGKYNKLYPIWSRENSKSYYYLRLGRNNEHWLFLNQETQEKLKMRYNETMAIVNGYEKDGFFVGRDVDVKELPPSITP